MYVTVCLICRSKYEKSTDNVSPPGYSQLAGQSGTELSKDSESSRLIIKKSWDLALGPLKQVCSLFDLLISFVNIIIDLQVPMNLFIMYMAGNSISIFPIMMVGMLIVRPVKALFSLQTSKLSVLNLVYVITKPASLRVSKFQIPTRQSNALYTI